MLHVLFLLTPVYINTEHCLHFKCFTRASWFCCDMHADVRYVRIVVEAFDILLVTCHSQSLNLFVESFLRMVQKLLECTEPDMQCLAVESVS